MCNDVIVGYGMIQLIELINKKEIDLSTTIEILNNSLMKLDPNSEKYVEKLNAITDTILELKNDKETHDTETFLKKMFYIQQLFDLNGLLTTNLNQPSQQTRSAAKLPQA